MRVVVAETLVIVVCLSFASISMAHHLDPSDPTQLLTSVKLGIEQQRLDEQQSTSFNIKGNYAFSKMMVSAETGVAERYDDLVTKSSSPAMKDLELQWHYRFDLSSTRVMRSLNVAAAYLTPLSDYKDGASFGYNIASLSLTGSIPMRNGKLELYPQISFNAASATDDLKKLELDLVNSAHDFEQVIVDVGISPKMDSPVYVTFTPGYGFSSDGRDNATYLQVLAGVFVSPMSAIELHAQYIFDDAWELDRVSGQGTFIQLSWEVHFK